MRLFICLLLVFGVFHDSAAAGSGGTRYVFKVPEQVSNDDEDAGRVSESWTGLSVAEMASQLKLGAVKCYSGGKPPVGVVVAPVTEFGVAGVYWCDAFPQYSRLLVAQYGIEKCFPGDDVGILHVPMNYESVNDKKEHTVIQVINTMSTNFCHKSCVVKQGSSADCHYTAYKPGIDLYECFVTGTTTGEKCKPSDKPTPSGPPDPYDPDKPTDPTTPTDPKDPTNPTTPGTGQPGKPGDPGSDGKPGGGGSGGVGGAGGVAGKDGSGGAGGQGGAGGAGGPGGAGGTGGPGGAGGAGGVGVGGAGGAGGPGGAASSGTCGGPDQPKCRIDESGVGGGDGIWDQLGDLFSSDKDGRPNQLNSTELGSSPFYMPNIGSALPRSACVNPSLSMPRGGGTVEMNICQYVGFVTGMCTFLWQFLFVFACLGTMSRATSKPLT